MIVNLSNLITRILKIVSYIQLSLVNSIAMCVFVISYSISLEMNVVCKKCEKYCKVRAKGG